MQLGFGMIHCSGLIVYKRNRLAVSKAKSRAFQVALCELLCRSTSISEWQWKVGKYLRILSSFDDDKFWRIQVNRSSTTVSCISNVDRLDRVDKARPLVLCNCEIQEWLGGRDIDEERLEHRVLLAITRDF